MPLATHDGDRANLAPKAFYISGSHCLVILSTSNDSSVIYAYLRQQCR